MLLFMMLSSASEAQRRSMNTGNIDKYLRKFGTVLYLIDNYYVEDADVKKLVDEAAVSIMKNLDPHSSYISEEEFRAMNEPLQGNFEGIGIEFNIFNDTLIVVSPISGGPSERVGLRSSDRIVAVDDVNIAGVGITNDKVFKLLRGPKGSRVHLTAMRAADKLEFDIVRDKIPIHSLDAAYEVKPGMIYLKLNKFAAGSMNEIYSAIKKFPKIQSMILDLRGNSGGLMNVATELSDQFLEAGRPIVYTEGEHARKQMEISTDSGFFKKGNLVILIDEGSASASEIVSGAVQDWDRGVILGRRSFGKGLVQQQFPLGDGSYIRLTVSRYHTPTGRVIQRHYDVGKTEEYYRELYKRFSGEVYSKDSIRFPDSLKYQTLVNRRTVYGGGAIMPDIFIPMDTAHYSEYSGKLNSKGIVYQFVLNYLDKNRSSLKAAYKTFGDYRKRFNPDAAFLEELVAYAEKEKIPRSEEGLKISGNYLKLLLKAYIARDLFSSSEFFNILNSIDKTYLRAVEVLENPAEYRKTLQ
jgi:carboxyl-terminal processing protease